MKPVCIEKGTRVQVTFTGTVVEVSTNIIGQVFVSLDYRENYSDEKLEDTKCLPVHFKQLKVI